MTTILQEPGSSGTHPSLAAHDSMGIATDAELTAHAATPHGGGAHPDLVTHDGLGLATDAELTAHAATPHGGSHPDLAAHDGLGLATDAELTAHAAAGDPHPAYETGAEAQARVDTHAATPHGGTHPDLATHDTLGLATDAELAAHAAAVDPHPTYSTDADLTAHAATTHGLTFAVMGFVT